MAPDMALLSLERTYESEIIPPSFDLALHQEWSPENDSRTTIPKIGSLIPKPLGELGRLNRGYGLRRELLQFPSSWQPEVYDEVQVSPLGIRIVLRK